MSISSQYVEERSILDILDPEIRRRAEIGGNRHYVLTKDGEEIGLLSIYYNNGAGPGGRSIEIGHVYILPKHRRSGHGTLLVETAEDLARRQRYPQVILKPWPVDNEGDDGGDSSSLDLDSLRRWYQRLGYSRMRECEEMMSKCI